MRFSNGVPRSKGVLGDEAKTAAITRNVANEVGISFGAAYFIPSL